MKKIIMLLMICLFYIFNISASEFCMEYHSNRLAIKGNILFAATSKGIVKLDKLTGVVSDASEELVSDSESTIFSIGASPEGNIYYADSQNGVYSYNGVSTTKLSATIPSFPYQVYAIVFEDNSNLWLSSVCYYSKFTSEGIGLNIYLIPDGYVVPNYGIITDMAFDSKNNLWIAAKGNDSHILCHKSGGNTSITKLSGKRQVCSLSIDNNDNIWFSDEYGIHCYNQETGKDSVMTNATNPDIPATQFYANDVDNQGNIWFTSSHYLLCFDGENFKWWNCYGYHEARSILCDGDIVWVLLKNDTLLKFQNNEFETIDLSPVVAGVEECIAEESNTKAYVSNGVLYIENAEGINSVAVYDAMGRNLTPNPSPVERGATNVQIPLPTTIKGVIMVKVNNEVAKVAIN